MRITWAGKLFAASVALKLASVGLRHVANSIPDAEPSRRIRVNCPDCGRDLVVPSSGRYHCNGCSCEFVVT